MRSVNGMEKLASAAGAELSDRPDGLPLADARTRPGGHLVFGLIAETILDAADRLTT